MKLKRFKIFLNENSNLKRSATSMSKFGIDSGLENWVFVSKYAEDIQVEGFLNKEDAIKRARQDLWKDNDTREPEIEGSFIVFREPGVIMLCFQIGLNQTLEFFKDDDYFDLLGNPNKDYKFTNPMYYTIEELEYSTRVVFDIEGENKIDFL